MAQRRMLAKGVFESDTFMDMPLSAQALYAHLVLNADDDGFLNNAKVVQRMAGASNDDLRILFARGFLLDMSGGVTVVSQWGCMNHVQADRYRPTAFSTEKGLLEVDDAGVYRFASEVDGNGVPTRENKGVSGLDTPRIQDDYNLYPQYRLVEAREGKEDESSGKPDPAPSKASESKAKDGQHAAEVREIVAYLNAQTGAHFKAASKATQRLVNARLAEGFTVDDLKRVVDVKAREWGGSEKWARYLRPETLFGTKAESYLQESVVADKAKGARKDTPYGDLF